MIDSWLHTPILVSIKFHEVREIDIGQTITQDVTYVLSLNMVIWS